MSLHDGLREGYGYTLWQNCDVPSSQIAEHQEIACLLVATLGRSDEQIHDAAVVVRFGARLSLDDRLHAHSDALGVLSISDRLEVAQSHPAS